MGWGQSGHAGREGTVPGCVPKISGSNGSLKSSKSGGVLRQGGSVKVAWIAEQGNAFVLAERCDVLDVSLSGYRAWKRGGKPDRQRRSDRQMRALIRSIPAELKVAYARRVLGREH